MKCANCSKDGFYIYQLAENTQMFYCEQHLPSFLIKAKKAGLLKTTESLAKAMAEGLETLTKKSNDVKEQTVAEPVVEKPKKKAAKKKAE